ncbi:MAG: hypothetical protein ACJ76I_02315 [Gaiellaceae bacterium]
MKTKLLAAAALVLTLAASVAVGAPAKGKPPTTCKPQVSVILTGKLAADAGATPTALSVTVSGGNRFARAYKGVTPVSVGVTSTTKVHRGTSTTWADLKSGDRVNIQARVCRSTLANGATPALTAFRVTAHAPTT